MHAEQFGGVVGGHIDVKTSVKFWGEPVGDDAFADAFNQNVCSQWNAARSGDGQAGDRLAAICGWLVRPATAFGAMAISCDGKEV